MKSIGLISPLPSLVCGHELQDKFNVKPTILDTIKANTIDISKFRYKNFIELKNTLNACVR